MLELIGETGPGTARMEASEELRHTSAQRQKGYTVVRTGGGT